MKDIKKIELVLENCESIDITNAVGDFDIDDVHIKIRRIATNCIAKTLCTNTVFIQLYKNGEYVYHSFDNNNNSINRLKTYKDITSIDIEYQDGSIESYYVDYDEGENEGMLGSENINQQIYETENNLFILISASKTFTDFDIEEVDADWYLTEDVNAKIDLKARGWEELFNSEESYRASLKSENLTVSLKKDKICLIKIGDIESSILFDTNVFN